MISLSLPSIILLFQTTLLLLISDGITTTTSDAFLLPHHHKITRGRSLHTPLPPYSFSSTNLHVIFKPLAREGDWAAYLDEEDTGLVYYFNGKTGESLWDPPTKTFPEVTLPEKTKESRVATSSTAVKDEPSLTATTGGDVVTTTTTTEAASPKKGLFANLFGSGVGGGGTAVTTTTDDEKNGQTVEDTKKVTSSDKATTTEESSATKTTTTSSSPSFLNDLRSAVKFPTAGTTKKTTTTTSTPTEPTTTTTTTPLKISVSSRVLPHPEKVSWGGEDALFVKGRTFGVFDGVSGAEKIAGAPLYSKVLSDRLAKLLSSPKKNSVALSIEEMQSLMLTAAEYADDVATGATTALMASVDDDGFMRLLNVGDSVCVVIRESNNGGKKKVVAKSKEIVHYFECPYQLAGDSPDRPKDGTTMAVEVMKGDIIVMGSDGVFDNLGDEEIEETVASVEGMAPAGQREKFIVNALVEKSRKVSLDDKAKTPYAKLAKRNGFEGYSDGLGGKVDDISCIVVTCN